VHTQINEYDFWSKFHYCTQWHIDSPKLLLWLCVLFYSSFVYTCVCIFLDIQSPLRECRSIRSGASGLPYYCAPLVCISAVIGLLAVWRHNKPKPKNQMLHRHQHATLQVRLLFFARGLVTLLFFLATALSNGVIPKLNFLVSRRISVVMSTFSLFGLSYGRSDNEFCAEEGQTPICDPLPRNEKLCGNL